MSNHDQRNVRIRIAIDVPLAGGEPTVRTDTGERRRLGEPEATRQRRPSTYSYGTIDKPYTGGNKVRWDGTTGYICAEGTTLEPDICAVAAVVLPGTSPVIPDCIPASASLASVVSDQWELKGAHEVPGVSGYPYHHAPNTFVLWYIYDDSLGGGQRWSQIATRMFLAEWGTVTECSGEPAAPPPPGMQRQQIMPPVVQNAARAWGVTAAGFQGAAVAAFNGTWVLKLSQPGQTAIAYDNGQDGGSAPRVELRCESACRPKWVLTFAHQGVAVQYTKSIDHFQANAVNVLSDVTTMGLHADASVPAHMTLTPA